MALRHLPQLGGHALDDLIDWVGKLPPDQLEKIAGTMSSGVSDVSCLIACAAVLGVNVLERLCSCSPGASVLRCFGYSDIIMGLFMLYDACPDKKSAFAP